MRYLPCVDSLMHFTLQNIGDANGNQKDTNLYDYVLMPVIEPYMYILLQTYLVILTAVENTEKGKIGQKMFL